MSQVHIEFLKSEEVTFALEELKEIRLTKDIKKSLRDAGKYLVKKGRVRLKSRLKTKRSKRTGLLLKSFSHRVKKKNIGVIVGFRKDNKHASLSWLIDRGTDSRYTDEKFAHRGSVRPTYFWDETRKHDTPEAQKQVINCIRNTVKKINNR